MTVAGHKKVPYSYLERQFADLEPYLEAVARVVRRGDFTLGREVALFEERFARLCGLPHAVGVGTGTDALALPMKLAGIGPGDEVVTAVNTFVATVGAICMLGARPVFVDVNDELLMDPAAVEAALTPRTRALLPVHWAGLPADMPALAELARRHGLLLFEDAAQAILASIDGVPVGSWGEAAAFSLHPLKNLNVWGDAGVVATRSADLDQRLRLIRNHGLAGRDEVVMWGHNSRLDTVQAAVGNVLLEQVEEITARRIAHARRLDEAFADLAPALRTPLRRPGARHVYHLYILRVAEDRDRLLAHLQERGIEAKIHYPVPLHLQPAARGLGYGPGDFPRAEAQAREILTLPVHQHLSEEELSYMIAQVRAFYGR